MLRAQHYQSSASNPANRSDGRNCSGPFEMDTRAMTYKGQEKQATREEEQD